MLGHRLPGAFDEKDRVVPEAARSARERHDLPFDAPRALRDYPGGKGRCRYADKCRGPRPGNMLHFFEKHDVVLLVGRLLARVPGGPYARSASQRLHRQAGIVRDAQDIAFLRVMERLDPRVLREGFPLFARFRYVRHVGQRQDRDVLLQTQPEQHLDLVDLPPVPGCDQQFHRPPFIHSFWTRRIRLPARSAASSIRSSWSRVNGSPSAVPCTSIRFPLPVMTTFMSTPATPPPHTPTLPAATGSRTGFFGIAPLPASREQARHRAIHAPLIEAVRVPPSAWRTSQSTMIVLSARDSRSTTARSDLPISRWISCVRPWTFPVRPSRWPRVVVARGSIAYSAVTQPFPVPRRNGGTRSSTEAAQTTFVSPSSNSTDPSACFCTPGVTRIPRRSPAFRPPARILFLCFFPSPLLPGKLAFRRPAQGSAPARRHPDTGVFRPVLFDYPGKRHLREPFFGRKPVFSSHDGREF